MKKDTDKLWTAWNSAACIKHDSFLLFPLQSINTEEKSFFLQGPPASTLNWTVLQGYNYLGWKGCYILGFNIIVSYIDAYIL